MAIQSKETPLTNVSFIAMSVGMKVGCNICSRVLGWEIKLGILACGLSDWTSRSAGPVKADQRSVIN